jgi:hypothetical protein
MMFGQKYKHKRDSIYLYQKIDTNYIKNYKDMLNARLVAVIRTNKFSIKNKLSQKSIEYSINENLNMGIGFSFKSIGFEFLYNPPGINKDDDKYGSSKQIGVSSSANGRKFIYDAYYRYNQGFHTTTAYKVANDTIYDYYRRSDIQNSTAGANIIYVMNNKKFSIAAPYNLTQKQNKSAGSLLLGTYAFYYGIFADSIIYPDTMYRNFNPEVQFKNATSLTFGLSCGYTYTIIFGKNWFFNLYLLPGISFQQFYSTNAFDLKVYERSMASLSLQSRLSLGFNKPRYFIGVSWVGNNFAVSDDASSTVNFKYGTFRFYYGHRFDLRKMLKKKL